MKIAKIINWMKAWIWSWWDVVNVKITAEGAGGFPDREYHLTYRFFFMRPFSQSRYAKKMGKGMAKKMRQMNREDHYRALCGEPLLYSEFLVPREESK